MKLPTIQILHLPHNSFSTVQKHSSAPFSRTIRMFVLSLGVYQTKFHTHNTTGKVIVSRILLCAPYGRRRGWKKKTIRNRKGDNILQISTVVYFFVNVISAILVPFPYIWALTGFERTFWLVWFVLLSGQWAWTTVTSFGAEAWRWICGLFQDKYTSCCSCSCCYYGYCHN
jgi:hypothetical protein